MLQLDGNASNRTVPFPKWNDYRSDTKSGTIRNRSAPVRSRPNRYMENMSTEQLRSLLNTKQSFRSGLNSLLVRSRNWNEDGTERLRSRAKKDYCKFVPGPSKSF